MQKRSGFGKKNGGKISDTICGYQSTINSLRETLQMTDILTLDADLTLQLHIVNCLICQDTALFAMIYRIEHNFSVRFPFAFISI